MSKESFCKKCGGHGEWEYYDSETERVERVHCYDCSPTGFQRLKHVTQPFESIENIVSRVTAEIEAKAKGDNPNAACYKPDDASFVCVRCHQVVVKDEGDRCPECEQERDEFYSDR